jgi:hypothetical protein
MIIVEGADNVGKTTFIQQLLALDPSLFVMKRERFNPRAGGTIGQSYLRMLLPPTDRSTLFHGIADRCLASECIYGQLFRAGCRMSEHEHFLIKTVLLSYGALVVHCDAPDAAIMHSWTERTQLYEHDPLVIAHAYRRRLQDIFRPIEVIKYDWTATDARSKREYIARLHQRILNRHAHGVATNISTCHKG